MLSGGPSMGKIRTDTRRIKLKLRPPAQTVEVSRSVIGDVTLGDGQSGVRAQSQR